MRCAIDDPNVALCGVDNALARTALEKPGFDLAVEAGLNAGPHVFHSFSMHTFPATRSAEEIWSRQIGRAEENFEDGLAYLALRDKGMDTCGLAQLVSRTVGVPFVGLIAASVAISELLRRLHGGVAFELASGSVAALEISKRLAARLGRIRGTMSLLKTTAARPVPPRCRTRPLSRRRRARRW